MPDCLEFKQFRVQALACCGAEDKLKLESEVFESKATMSVFQIRKIRENPRLITLTLKLRERSCQLFSPAAVSKLAWMKPIGAK